ncbi:MAG: G5 domain-containing protein [Oscillospiraceae bacterium]|nr:G5 domain-containing protein [Oscillospiraceae bacterium]
MKELFKLGEKKGTANIKKRIVSLSAASAALLAVGAFSLAAGISNSGELAAQDADLSAYRYEQAAVEAPASLPETDEDTEKEYTVTVTADGKKITVKASGKVSDALKAAGITVNANDLVNISEDEPLNENTEIVVQRVQYFKRTNVKKIDYATEYRDDDELDEGESVVVVDGEEGEMVIESIVKKIDGKVVASRVTNKEIRTEPTDEIISRGTRSADDAEEDTDEESAEIAVSEDESVEDSAEEEWTFVDDTPAEDTDEEDDYADQPEKDEGEAVDEDHTEDSQDDAVGVMTSADVSCISHLTPDAPIELDENGIPVSYQRTVYGKSCAYTAGEGALMSTGKAVDQGYVAVNPDIIPYGSKLYIVADDGEVYGYAIAADTGGSVRRNAIVVDLFMWSYDECIQWGAKNVTIYIIEEG